MLSLIRATRLRDIMDTNHRLAADFVRTALNSPARLEHVESELMSAKLDRFFEELHLTIELAARQGVEAAEAVEKGLRAMAAPLPRGRAGLCFNGPPKVGWNRALQVSCDF